VEQKGTAFPHSKAAQPHGHFLLDFAFPEEAII
jgi:hypothetical protein